ncbi:MAG: hypothetical protein ACQKBY_07585 [Verrucomicrobiales bacterium]
MSFLRDPFGSEGALGISGIGIAMFVFLAFSGLAALVYQGLEEQGPSIETEIRKNREEITRLEKDIVAETAWQEEQTTFASQAAEKDEKAAQVMHLVKDLAAAVKERDEAQGLLEKQVKNWEDYKNRYRKNEREGAIGEVHDLSKNFDDRYRKAEIRAITDMEMRIMLSTGPKSIPYRDLPADLQDRFQFDDAQAEAMKKKLAEWEKKRTQRISRKMEDDEVKEAARSKQRAKGEIASLHDAITACYRQIEQNELKIEHLRNEVSRYQDLHARARARGNISSHLSSAAKAQREIKSLLNTNQKWNSKIRGYEARIRALGGSPQPRT